MNKDQFKDFCKKEFETKGFKRIKKMYYLLGKDLLCGIELQKSYYSESYYINYYFFLGEFNDSKNYPIRYDMDVQGRITAMSRKQTIDGKQFLTDMIEYEEYTEEELRPYFDKDFEEKILPPICYGKKYILDNLRTLYFLTLHQEEVLQKLQS